MSESNQATTVDELEWKATNTPVDTHTAYALAVALDEGAISAEEAADALEFRANNDSLDWISSNHYPGDEYYDKADLRYGGLY